MIGYRCLTEREIGSMLTGMNTTIKAPKGPNTFQYETGVSYRHFFHFYDSAIFFLENQNAERYYNEYSIIAAYEIPDDLASQQFGYGIYNVLAARFKDEVLCTFQEIDLPEYAIPESQLSACTCVGIGNTRRITPLQNMSLTETIIDNQKEYAIFLNNQIQHNEKYQPLAQLKQLKIDSAMDKKDTPVKIKTKQT